MVNWSILGIEPTKDISKIKKAYAQRLKIYHPEDDPAGFQKLREAYDAAVKYSKDIYENINITYERTKIDVRQQAEATEKIDEEVNDNSFPKSRSSRNNTVFNYKEHTANSRLDTENMNAAFMQQVEYLYNNFFLRIDIENWRTILNSDIIWNIKNRENLRIKISEFLFRHYHLPVNIWQALDYSFQWSNVNNNEQYDEAIKLIINRIIRTKELSYAYFIEVEGVDYETYLNYREAAFFEVERCGFKKCHFLIEKAKEIYNDDPDLLLIEGKCFMRESKYNKAISIFNKLLSKFPDHSKALYYRGIILYKTNKYRKAIKDFTELLNDRVEYRDVYFYLGRCYFKIRKFEKAKECYLKALDFEPKNIEIMECTLHVNYKIKGRLLIQMIGHFKDQSIRVQYKKISSEIEQQKKCGITCNRFGDFFGSIYDLYVLIFKKLTG